METTSACQLRCIMCAREQALEKGTLKVGQMEERLAVKIIDEIVAVAGRRRLPVSRGYDEIPRNKIPVVI